MDGLEATALRLAVLAQTRPRIAVRGRTMWPLLREPMVLELGPFNPRTANGRVVALDLGGDVVLRRIIGARNGSWLVCADAHPLATTTVKEQQIVGQLDTVYSDDSGAARPLNRKYFAAGNALVARSHAVRALADGIRNTGGAALQFAGLRQATFPFQALLNAMSAIVNDDWEALSAALDACSAPSIIALALRHGCTGILIAGMRRAKLLTVTRYESLGRGLETSASRIKHETAAAKKQIADIVRIFSREQLPFALLKGSARLFSGREGIEQHPSTDIDILLPADMIGAAADALRHHGYTYGHEADVAPYLAYHHHAAPLVPPAKGLNVELHFALAPPRMFSQRLDWQTLKTHIISIATAAGTAGCLDAFGSALHLCVHSVGVRKLRDVVLLGQMLREQPTLLDALEEFGAHETWEPVRLASVLALAARIARIQRPEAPVVRGYLRWLLGREDLPPSIRRRTEIIEDSFRSDTGRQAVQRYAAQSHVDHWLHPRTEGFMHAAFHRAVGLVARGLTSRAAALRDRKTYKQGRRSYPEPKGQWYNAKSESSRL